MKLLAKYPASSITCHFANHRKAYFIWQLATRTVGHLLSTRRVLLQATLQVPGKRILLSNCPSMQIVHLLSVREFPPMPALPCLPCLPYLFVVNASFIMLLHAATEREADKLGF